MVLLFLPDLPYAGSSFDAKSKDRITRNLMYVAMTRAMDHLNVFVGEESHGAVLADLKTSIQQ